jgi:uncharacterized protein (TIRG00374 family)
MKKAGWIVVALLLVIALTRFDFHSLGTSLRQVPLPALLALLGLQVVTQLLLNYQWCRIGLAIGGKHGFWQMLYVNARGAVVDAITPGVKAGGEVARGVLLVRAVGYSPQQAAVLVTIQKIASLFSFFLINLAAFTHISTRLQTVGGPALQGAVYTVLLGFLGLTGLLLTRAEWIEQRAASWKPTWRWSRALRGYLTTLVSSLKDLKEIKGELFRQFALASAIWLLYPVKMILLVRLFTPQFDPVIVAEITFIAYMVGMIPLLPGGLGGFEAVMASLLMAVGVEASSALAITLLFRFITFWSVMALSLVYIGIWKLRGETR